MPGDDLDFQMRLYQRLQDEPLQPDDELYEPIYKVSEDVEEPIDLLKLHIDWSLVESVQFFSGFRGSGKTTELFRLQKKLEEGGCFVVYADALNYINPAGEIDITDLLLVLAGAFSDGLEGRLNQNVGRDSYWSRFINFLTKTEIDLKSLGIKVGSKDAGLELKADLKGSPTFRQKFQKHLEQHVPALKADFNGFFEECVKAIQAERGANAKIVFIFDSLEQLRGSVINEENVINSIVKLFENHQDKLRIPYIHVVYTIPPWLKFLLQGMMRDPVTLIPSVRQWNNDAARTPYDPGRNALRSLVRRRVQADGWEKLFGSSDPAAADRLIDVCGGHFRDLLRMLREMLLRAKTLPVSTPVMDRAISTVRSQYLPISVSNARWLARIAEKRRPDQDTDGDTSRLARFLDSHMVLYLMNGEEWYDIHPLIRDEVAKIVADNPETPPTSTD